MLCSEQELKLAEESAGIMILPVETPLGRPLADASGFPTGSSRSRSPRTGETA